VDVTDVPCTALDADWGDDRPNALMHPQCTCPRCTPTEIERQRKEPGWLRMSGSRTRHRVEEIELGELGSDLLG